MAKKNFTDSLIGNNRTKKLDMLVSKPSEAVLEAEPMATPQPKTMAKEATLPSVSKDQPAAQVVEPTAEAPKKRGRKKKDVEKDSFFYTVDKDFLFEVKAAAFWDRRDISEFITRSLKYYMDTEMGESEIRRAVREFKSRLEEGTA
ncbi:MAG: hypothetical protein R2828_35620 [Saprospiraceae bacterium]